MEQKTTLGHNRTGIQMSPLASASMRKATETLQPMPADEPGYVNVRMAYAIEAEPLGSVPVSASLSGIVHMGADMVNGQRSQVLIDKLGERLAFERGGVRLYEALLVKCGIGDSLLPGGALHELQRFRNEEAEHLALVVEALQALGADPTVQTPCADLVGVESAGLVQAMNDPRSSLLQGLHVMLDAELLDNAAWEMLIDLARASGHEEIAEKFGVAMVQEANHLAHLKAWVSQLTLKDAGLDGGGQVGAAH